MRPSRSGRASDSPMQLRLTRRVISEVLAATLWPLQCISIILVPLLPLAATGFAEFERARARECGERAPSQRSDVGTWTSWTFRRVRTPALWRHDLPLTLASTAVGLFSATALAIALLAVAVLVLAPIMAAQGSGIALDSVVVRDPVGTGVVMLVCVAALAAAGSLLVAFSLLRDALVRAFSRDAVELTARLDAVSSNRAEIVVAFEQERRRIERDLHDGVQQDLLALSMTLGLLEFYVERSPSDAVVSARRARDQVEHALVSLRDIVQGIHPAELSDLGLEAAVTGLCERSALDVELEVKGDVELLDIAAASALYFSAAEALNNVERHARTRTAKVRLQRSKGSVQLLVTDEGIGAARLDDTRSTGLGGLRKRLRGVGGELRIVSTPGAGTMVEAVAPIGRL